ncbi:MAG: hypothetical protein HUU50_02355 [Candidatus Brocadiae bacterium]|nr:hypothetical protein [Candidatus Brocadiia bacterium]
MYSTKDRVLLWICLSLFPYLLSQDISSWSAEKRFRMYFATLAKISRENLPIAKNGANGWFRNKVAYSDFLQSLKKEQSGSSPTPLMEVFREFYEKFHYIGFQSFAVMNASVSSNDSIWIVWEDWIEYEAFVNRVVWAMTPILPSTVDREEWKKKRMESALASFRIIQSKKVCYSGHFINGWMLVPIGYSGKSSLSLLERHFPHSQDPFIQALKNTFTVFLEIEHHPKKHISWVTADWQLRIQILFEAWESLESYFHD